MDVKQDLQNLREKLARLRKDPPAFRFAVAAVVLAVGLAGVTMPLGGSLDAKRVELRESKERSAVAARIAGHLEAWAAVASRVHATADAVDWGDYVLEHLRAAGLRALSQEPPEVIELGEFKAITLRMRAGGEYAEIVDFLDRLERGARLMRVDRLAVTIGEQELELSLEVVGLAGTPPEEWSAPAAEEDA